MDELQTVLAAFVAEVATAPDDLSGSPLASGEIVKKLERLLGSAAAADRKALPQFAGDPPDEAEG
jgi:hypothetical protein